MKSPIRFLVSLLAVVAWTLGSQHAQACIDDGFTTYNQYVFRVSPYECKHAYNRSIRAALKTEWEQYAHCTLTEADMDSLAVLTTDQVDHMQHPVLNYARQRSDFEMLKYLKLLAQYLELTAEYNNEWYYPDADEVAVRNERMGQLLQSVRTIAKTPRMDARYNLLLMRLYYRLGNYTECERLWAKSRVTQPSNIFERMAYGFYAGALFRLGKREAAAEAFAKVGDCMSARFCLYSNTGADCIGRVARADANADVLPVMIENFINSVQETHDFVMTQHDLWLAPDESYVYGPQGMSFTKYVVSQASYAHYKEDYTPYFSPELLVDNNEAYKFECEGTYPVYNREVEDFLKLSAEMLNRPDLKDAALWASARAYILYMRGRRAEAWQAIKDVRQLSASTSRISENARIVRALIATTLTDEAQMEAEVVDELKWLEQSMKREQKLAAVDDESAIENWDNYSYYQSMLRRIIVHGLAAHYQDDGKENLVQLCYFVVDNIDNCSSLDDGELWSRFYEGEGTFLNNFKILSYAQQKDFFDFLVRNDEGLSALQTYLKSMTMGYGVDNDLRDYIGTCCLQEGRWQEAIEWLEPIPVSYLNKQHIAPYAARRTWTNEQWFRHVKVDEDEFYDSETYNMVVNLKRNAKLDFCRDMLRLQGEMLLSTGEGRCLKAYELATALFNASARGDCWWLARYKVGSNYMFNTDEWMKDPATAFDFVGEAQKLTSEALKTSDSRLKSRVLMARFYMHGEPPYDVERDYDTDDCIYLPNYNTLPYTAFTRLQDMLKSNQPVDPRISRCDVVLRCMRIY